MDKGQDICRAIGKENDMTLTQHAEQAMHNLCLARIIGNEAKVRYWQTRVDYYTERVHDDELKGGK